MYVYCDLFIYLFIDAYIASIFWRYMPTDNVLWTYIYWVPVFHSFSYVPGSGIAWLLGNYVFNFLKNHSFASCWIILYSYLQCLPLSVSPCAHQYLLNFLFVFSYNFPSGVKWLFIIILICIPVATNDVSFNVFGMIFLFLFCIFYLERWLFKSLAHFWVWMREQVFKPTL